MPPVFSRINSVEANDSEKVLQGRSCSNGSQVNDDSCNNGSHISNEKCNNNIEKPKLATTLESTAEKGCYRERKQSIKNYCICYENNGSKRWDGKEVLVDKELLEELYTDIRPGMQIQLPWTGKKGKTTLWYAVVVDDADKPSPKRQHLENQRQSEDKKTKKKGKGN